MQDNYKNEVLKRDYETYLTNAQGLAPNTINIARRALSKFDEFSNQQEYVAFSIDTAVKFKEWLKTNNTPATSYACYCKQLQKFLTWLATQKGFKQKITAEVITYLKISNKDEALASSRAIKKTPTLEYVKSLVNSIPAKTEVDLRDRALIAFACLTGIRDSALSSLPLKALDIDNLVVYQNPSYGVKTKFTKNITSKVFSFDDSLSDCVKVWHKLLKDKGFEDTAPLFPQSKMQKGKDNLSFEPSQEVAPLFWSAGGAVRGVFKQRAEKANLAFFAPHTYRHLAINLALSKATSGDEIKAISQNFGHEHIGTTFSVYGNYQPEDLINKLTAIDGRTDNDNKTEDSEKLKKIKDLLQ